MVEGIGLDTKEMLYELLFVVELQAVRTGAVFPQLFPFSAPLLNPAVPTALSCLTFRLLTSLHCDGIGIDSFSFRLG